MRKYMFIYKHNIILTVMPKLYSHTLWKMGAVHRVWIVHLKACCMCERMKLELVCACTHTHTHTHKERCFRVQVSCKHCRLLCFKTSWKTKVKMLWENDDTMYKYVNWTEIAQNMINMVYIKNLVIIWHHSSVLHDMNKFNKTDP